MSHIGLTIACGVVTTVFTGHLVVVVVTDLTTTCCGDDIAYRFNIERLDVRV